jgi:hypothetical protein
MSVRDAIAAAEGILPGEPAPDGELDPRWQAIIAVGEFVELEPQLVWQFALRWGSTDDEDLRAAVATCLLEHLLEHHFDTLLPEMEAAARGDAAFARALGMCWKFGLAEEPDRAKRFERLLQELAIRSG